MDVLPELLAAALVPKAESTGNNKKQKNEHYKKEALPKKADVSAEDEVDENKAKLVERRSNWVEKDRRSTNDRRKQVAKRGRWLESRDTKDRRKSNKTISITI
ncbi:hypothetical protein WNY51_01470 [Pseudocolwellia sp. AS88]|uniref:hypothetical protein n=1 Tax=Pseudocolwellia sp. AS88 TaxID=3063958 RepID=UPI0026EDBC62|nr:hypothetical protein [Pseudocolwellia sp. AS88]MDO7084702.1 hypothetical protein [Pseudocolwellia sp. AS88]